MITWDKVKFVRLRLTIRPLFQKEGQNFYEELLRSSFSLFTKKYKNTLKHKAKGAAYTPPLPVILNAVKNLTMGVCHTWVCGNPTLQSDSRDPSLSLRMTA